MLSGKFHLETDVFLSLVFLLESHSFVYEIVQVIVPSTGKLALDMMCGEWGASRCSPKKWFAFMGDAAGNPFVPFPINYITDKVDDLIPLNPPIIPCNKAVNVSCNYKKIVFTSQMIILWSFCNYIFRIFFCQFSE